MHPLRLAAALMLFAGATVALPHVALAEATNHPAYDRAVFLGELVNRVGIVEAARLSKDTLDRSILDLVAPLYSGQGGEEALSVLGEKWGPMPPSQYVIRPSTRPGEPAPLLFSSYTADTLNVAPQYLVEFTNNTEELLSEVVAFYRTKAGMTVWPPVSSLNLDAGQGTILNLGFCSNMNDYALAVLIGNRQVAKIPQTGTLTPAVVSKMHPNDQNPCVDSWFFGAVKH